MMTGGGSNCQLKALIEVLALFSTVQIARAQRPAWRASACEHRSPPSVPRARPFRSLLGMWPEVLNLVCVVINMGTGPGEDEANMAVV
jgi:hypothetical protein